MYKDEVHKPKPIKHVSMPFVSNVVSNVGLVYVIESNYIKNIQ